MLQVISEATVRFIDYLNDQCAGEDRHAFWTPEGEPDFAHARAFADLVREQCGDATNELIAVEQRNNLVLIKSLIEWEDD